MDVIEVPLTKSKTEGFLKSYTIDIASKYFYEHHYYCQWASILTDWVNVCKLQRLVCFLLNEMYATLSLLFALTYQPSTVKMFLWMVQYAKQSFLIASNTIRRFESSLEISVSYNIFMYSWSECSSFTCNTFRLEMVCIATTAS